MKTIQDDGTAEADRKETAGTGTDGGKGVAVVIDYQNMHLCGWDSYSGDDGGGRYSVMLDPVELSRVIAGKYGSWPRRVVIFRGLPDRSRKSYWYDREQERVWKAESERLGINAEFVTRPMKCNEAVLQDGTMGEHIEEKGIDIACALEFIDMAYRGDYDHVVLCSHDTDFGPALEKAVEYGADVAQAYWGDGCSQEFRPIRLRGGLECPVLKLTQEDYAQCLDGHDWSYALRAAPKVVREGIRPISADPSRARLFARIAGASLEEGMDGVTEGTEAS